MLQLFPYRRLMMWQRLDGRGTLSVAVQQVVQGLLGALLPPDKRVCEQRVSNNPGGLCRARKRLPLEAAEAVGDEVFSKLTAAEPAQGFLSRLFLLDGSSMRLTHTSSLVAAHPFWNDTCHHTYPGAIIAAEGVP